MMKQTAGNISVNRVADAAFAASRQVWLAGLGRVDLRADRLARTQALAVAS